MGIPVPTHSKGTGDRPSFDSKEVPGRPVDRLIRSYIKWVPQLLSITELRNGEGRL